MLMNQESLLTGMLAVLDPSARVFPARPPRTTVTPRTFTEGAEALLAELDRPLAADATGIPDDLPVLRIVTVRVSFVSAVLTVLCVPPLAFGIEWPLIVVAVASLAATSLIISFFAGLRRSTARRAAQQQLHHHQMKELLEGLARERVAELEDRELIERSKNSPELTSAILATIMTEYADAEQPAKAHAEKSDSPARSLSLARVLAVAGPQHPLARVLRRLASDVTMTDTSEAH
ncbi:hypothetical protein AB0G67_46455 [Streptomyces sp. NPDC021056]|uniref:hypothetical protein n=1 Tax=Streptomyces sp. NPDC021056 TaxID=3155012 RepID=UPI0033D39148